MRAAGTILLHLLMFILIIGNMAMAAQAERRVALVIGNADYIHAGPLANPLHDAHDLAQALDKLGFEVLKVTDVDGARFEKVSQEFSEMLQGADVALLFYAGHALQFQARNYLVPTDARLENEAAIASETIAMSELTDLMERKAKINLVFLDACRDNPLATRLFRNITRTRSTVPTQGLSRHLRQNGETLVVYATAPDHVAEDGAGRNSPFTAALLRHIASPNIEVEVMLKRVTRAVLTKTDARQKPERLSQLTHEFYFKKEVTAAQRIQKARLKLNEQIRQYEQLLLIKKNKHTERFPSPNPTPVSITHHQTIALPEMVRIPAGTYQMGCLNDGVCRRDEKPAHPVTLTAFEMAKYETTFAQWDACVADGGCRPIVDDEGWGRGNRPVINVTWRDAAAYTHWLSRKTGQDWRLPTEAEWEYAARAGSTTAFAHGNTLDRTKANIAGKDGTVPVGRYQANAWGLHDMHGNVWEWVGDRYGSGYYGTGQRSDPKGPSVGQKRVNRGGGWYYPAKYARSAMRSAQAPNVGRSNVGFRVVRAVRAEQMASVR